MKQMSRCQVSYFHTDGWPSYRRVLPLFNGQGKSQPGNEEDE